MVFLTEDGKVDDAVTVRDVADAVEEGAVRVRVCPRSLIRSGCVCVCVCVFVCMLCPWGLRLGVGLRLWLTHNSGPNPNPYLRPFALGSSG